MIEPASANYRPLMIPKYQGNPLIEALPPPLSAEVLRKCTMALPQIPANLAAFSPLERKMMAADLMLAFVTPQQSLRLYEEVYLNVCEGYVARNPLNPAVISALYKTRDPFGPRLPGSKTASSSMLFIGPTGFGKTAIVRSVFSQLPAVISHTRYDDQPLLLKQVVYLKIDCPSNGSARALINNLWRAFDTALGTNLYEQYLHVKWKVPDLQARIALACAIHSVGFLVVDEVHYLRPVLEDGDKERATLPFMDELLNGIGIPVLLIGTWKSARLLNRNMTTIRRACSGLSLTEYPYAADNKYWRKLVSKALLTKLLTAAQKRAIDTGKESVDVKILQEVYQFEFVLLQDALSALRRKDCERYEDLLPREKLDGI